MAQLDVVVTESGISATDSKLKKLTATGKQTESAMSELADSVSSSSSKMGNASASADKARTGVMNLRQAAQQAGYQIQDFAVQVSSGQSVLTAFGQQGSQLAMIMGPSGAVVGAIIAVASAIGGALVTAANSGTNALDRMKSKVEDLTTAQKEYLKIELGKDISDVNKQIESFNGNLEVGKTVGTGWSKTIILNNQGIVEQQANLDGLKQKLKEYTDRMNELNGGPSQEANKNFKDLTYQLQQEAAAAGKGELAQKILTAQMQLGKTATQQQKDEVAKLVTNIYNADEAYKKATESNKAATAAAKKDETQYKANEARIADATLKTQQLKQERENLTRGTDQIIAGTSRYSQATAELAAKQALGTTATQDQIDRLAEQLLAQDRVTESIEKMKKAQEDKKDLSKLTSDFQKDAYDSSYTTDLEKQQEYHEQRLKQIQDHNNTEYAASVEGQKMITDAKLAEETRYQNQVNSLRQASLLNSMSNIQSSTSIITSALSDAGKTSTGLYRTLFAAQKAAAIPSMIVATEKGATEALAYGPIAGPIFAAMIKGLGYASIGVVAGQAIAGRAQGGQVIAGKTYNVGERGMETFTPSQNGWITPNGGNTNHISATNNVYNYAGVNVKTTPNESGGTDTYITRDEFADLMAVHGADPNSKFNRSRGTVYRQQRA